MSDKGDKGEELKTKIYKEGQVIEGERKKREAERERQTKRWRQKEKEREKWVWRKTKINQKGERVQPRMRDIETAR